MRQLKAFINKEVIKRMRHNGISGLEKVSLDEDLLHKFGYVVEIRSGVHYITLGESWNEPDYVTVYREDLDLDESLEDIMITLSNDTVMDWNYIEVLDYGISFPKDLNMHKYDIVAMYELPIELKDIATVDKLKAVFKKYNLKAEIK